MNLNKIAKNITLKEGKKISLPIGQVKEVIRLFIEEMERYTPDDIIEMMQRQWFKKTK